MAYAGQVRRTNGAQAVTKIRETRDSSMIDDRRGQGGGGGGGGLGGLGDVLGRMGGGGGGGWVAAEAAAGWASPKMGGGMIGILLMLAVAFLPKLLKRRVGGAPSIGAHRNAGQRQRCEHFRWHLRRRAGEHSVRCNDRRAEILGRRIPGTRRGVRGHQDGVLQRLDQHRLRASNVANRTVLLPCRSPGLLRFRLPGATAEPVRCQG